MSSITTVASKLYYSLKIKSSGQNDLKFQGLTYKENIMKDINKKLDKVNEKTKQENEKIEKIIFKQDFEKTMYIIDLYTETCEWGNYGASKQDTKILFEKFKNIDELEETINDKKYKLIAQELIKKLKKSLEPCFDKETHEKIFTTGFDPS